MPELDGVVVAGPVVVGRDAVELVFDGTGAGVGEADVIFAGVSEAVSAGDADAVSVGTAASVLRETDDVAGTVSLAKAGPADVARQNAMADNTAAVDLDLRDISGCLDSPGFVLAHGRRGVANRETACRKRSSSGPVAGA